MSWALMALALQGVSLSTPSQSNPPDTPPRVITRPDWLKRPSAANMYDVWPGGAYYAHVPGRVVLQCVVNEKGRLRQCVATVEEPSGWGFGDAAKEMAAQFQMKPQTVDGEPVAGALINIPIDFAFSDGPRRR